MRVLDQPTLSRIQGGAIYEQLSALPAAAAALFERDRSSGFFSTLAWYEHLLGHGIAGAMAPRIYVAGDPRQPAAAVAMRFERRRTFLRPRMLQGLANYYTSLFGPVLDPAYPMAGALQALARLMCEDRAGWDVIDLHPMDREAPAFDALAEAFRGCGMAVESYFCFGNWYLPVAGRDFAQYYDTLPSAVRNTLKRKRKKLTTQHSVRIDIITGGAELNNAIEAYQRIYASSWKQPEPFPNFIPELIQLCAREGWLRLGTVHVDGAPAAAQLWMVRNGHAAIYKLAYDERFATHSVGSILTAELMQHVIDVDRVEEVDYLTGDDAYKRDWMSHRRERWGIRACNPRRVNGLIAAGKQILGRAVRRVRSRSVSDSATGTPLTR